nr:MAG TPA: replisome organizer [Caudoviricetes sp.]
MPNRIIKESLCSSEKIASLSDFEFRLWVGLITQVDDAGRGDARPAIIKGRVFPFRERLSIKDIDAALQALAAKGCVSLYTVDGKPYFLFPGWVKHQRVRDCKPKYPEPLENLNLPQSAASCGELPQSAALIQSESEFESNPKEYCAEPQAADAPPVISLPLNDGTFFDVSENDRAKWSQLYPNVDVLQQIRNMAGWCDANPTKRKTRGGIKRFITAWLAREQDKGGKAPQNKPFVYDYGNTEGSL